MAWSVPLTAVSNASLTAAQWNASVRDNLLETAVAKVTGAGQYVVSTAANALAARTPQASSIATVEATTSTSYANLATTGPAVTVTSGTVALVGVSTNMSNSTVSVNTRASYAVSGATTIAASDIVAFNYQQPSAGTTIRGSAITMQTGLTAGSNTFTMQYRVTANTGTFDARHLWVVPF